MSRLSLRARLVLGVIVLAAAGLAAANVATYTSLHSFLIDRTDQALQESRRGYDHLDHGDCEDRKGGPGGPSRGGNAGDFIQVRTGNGDVACTSQQSGFDDNRLAAAPAGRCRGSERPPLLHRLLRGRYEPVSRASVERASIPARP